MQSRDRRLALRNQKCIRQCGKVGQARMSSLFGQLVADATCHQERIQRRSTHHQPLQLSAMVVARSYGMAVSQLVFRWVVMLTPSCFNVQAAALAAGNCLVLKPSEQSPAIAALFAELVPKYLDPQLARVVNGGVPETAKVRFTGPFLFRGEAQSTM